MRWKWYDSVATPSLAAAVTQKVQSVQNALQMGTDYIVVVRGDALIVGNADYQGNPHVIVARIEREAYYEAESEDEEG